MPARAAKLKSPFPYIGGKSRAAALVWEYFGNPQNYCEPFCGSLAALLLRPGRAKIETVNDKNMMIANFWRSIKQSPQATAIHADHAVIEADLHAWHSKLVELGNDPDFQHKIKTNPDFHDPLIAGRWVWGQSMWIGGGWCEENSQWQARPQSSSAGTGIHQAPTDGRKPHLARTGRGVHRESLHKKRPNLDNHGKGVHKGSLSQQIPRLSGPGQKLQSHRPQLIHHGEGIHAKDKTAQIYNWFNLLSARLRRVRVCCGDWSRICTPAVTTGNGVTGVFLDPPYSAESGRAKKLYATEDLNVAHDVRRWAIENGDNPLFRIALCGYEGEHELPDNWTCESWKASGGYSNRNADNQNRHRERIWFSPHCIKATLF